MDSSGRIYVTNYGPGNGRVTVYAANPAGVLNEAPITTIAVEDSQLGSPSGITVDANGDVYVVNEGGYLTVYAAASSTPSSIMILPPLQFSTGLTGGVALDGAGNIYVPTYGEINVYAQTQLQPLQSGPSPSPYPVASPVAVIQGSNVPLYEPTQIVIDSGGRIYVTDYGAEVYVFPTLIGPGQANMAPITTIGGTSGQFSGLAIH